MASRGYKKYMKQDTRQGHPLLKIFILSFFGMLLLSTFVISSLARKMTVDTSVGDYKEQQIDDMEGKKIIDMNRLEMIQSEDQGRNFSDIMSESLKTQEHKKIEDQSYNIPETKVDLEDKAPVPTQSKTDIVYKVFVGSYTSAEQAKVAKEIIQESGSGLNPIVKCIGTNDYTLQVGIFKNKQSAETMLSTIQKSNLPGRIVQDN